MLYINSQPNEIGNHGSPMVNHVSGMVCLPDELLEEYISAKGFVFLTISEYTVTAVEVNQEALDAYEASLPPLVPEPEPMTQAEIEEMLLDQEYRILLLEYGLEDEEVW